MIFYQNVINYVVLEKGHGAREKGHDAREKGMASRHAKSG